MECLTLLECAAEDAGGVLSSETSSSWAYFFTALATDAKFLKTLTLKHLLDEDGLLDYFGRREDLENFISRQPDKVKEALGQIQTIMAGREEAGEGDWRRRKRVLPHKYLDDKYGFLEVDGDGTAERFLEGADHKAMIELWKVLEERGGEGVIYL